MTSLAATTADHRTSTGRTTLDLGATPASRNRAIDAYRAVAMCAVALGHWLAADVRITDRRITGGNALDKVPSLHLLTWVFQVMPLFFCIGGYSNTASLDSHHRTGRPDGEWVRTRLLRLTTPSAWLAGTWVTVLVVGHLVGVGSIVDMAVGVAAIPLWFLANYVADTALSPITLRLYRTHGMRFVAALLGVFAIGEAARFPGVHYVPQINIVVGWLLFQVLGFAWKDGRLPQGRRLVALGAAAWTLAGVLVAVGPWPLAMVSVPGAKFANTWPPSLALMSYGLGLCSFAIAAAPAIGAVLTRRNGLWKAVVVANTMTMTSYLWHFTALSIAAVVFSRVGLLPSAAVGTGAWWMQKLPLLAASFVVLGAIVGALSGKERTGLLSGSEGARSDGTRTMSVGVVTTCALVLAAGFETWTAAEGNPAFALPGMLAVLGVHTVLDRSRR